MLPKLKTEVEVDGALDANAEDVATEAAWPKTKPLLGVDVLVAVDDVPTVLGTPNITFGGVLFATVGALNVIGLIAAAGADEPADADAAGEPNTNAFVSAFGLFSSVFFIPPKADKVIGLKSEDVAEVEVVEVTVELATDGVEVLVSFVEGRLNETLAVWVVSVVDVVAVEGFKPKLKPVEGVVVVSDLLLSAAG